MDETTTSPRRDPRSGDPDAELQHEERSPRETAQLEDNSEQRGTQPGRGELSSGDPVVGTVKMAEVEVVRWGRVVVAGLGVLLLHIIMILMVYPMLPKETALRLALGFLPYLLGGIGLAILSRQGTLLEAFYSVVLPAVILPFVTEVFRVYETQPEHVAQAMERVGWYFVWGASMISVLLALLGCRLGKWLTLRTQRG